MTVTNQNTSEKRVRKTHRDYSKLNLVITVLAVLGNLLMLFTLFNITKFASLGKAAFIALNLIVLIIQLIINVLVISAVSTHKAKNYTIGMLFAVILFAVGTVGTIAVIRVEMEEAPEKNKRPWCRMPSAWLVQRRIAFGGKGQKV